MDSYGNMMSMTGSWLVVGNYQATSVMTETLYDDFFKEQSINNHVYLICSASNVIIDKYESMGAGVRIWFHRFSLNGESINRDHLDIPRDLGFSQVSIIDDGLSVIADNLPMSGYEFLNNILKRIREFLLYAPNWESSHKIPKKKKKLIKKASEAFSRIICNYCVFDIQYIGQAFGSDDREVPRSATERLIEGHKTFTKILSVFQSRHKDKEVRILELDCEVQATSAMLSINSINGMDIGDKIKSNGMAFSKDYKSKVVTLEEAGLIRYFKPPFNKEFVDTFPSSTHVKKYAEFLKKSRFDHVGFNIDISQECMAIRRPEDDVIIDHISRSWNLDTKKMERTFGDAPIGQYPGDLFLGKILATNYSSTNLV